MKGKRSSEIDDYVEQFPREVQLILERVRRTIRAAAPGAEEAFKYGIPTFTLQVSVPRFPPDGCSELRREEILRQQIEGLLRIMNDRVQLGFERLVELLAPLAQLHTVGRVGRRVE